MIRRGHYNSNNFQDSNKRKITEKKTLCYLPRVLFFNAFELGPESGKEWTGVHSSLVMSLHKINNKLGK
jgi:hypothetical protein